MAVSIQSQRSKTFFSSPSSGRRKRQLSQGHRMPDLMDLQIPWPCFGVFTTARSVTHGQGVSDRWAVRSGGFTQRGTRTHPGLRGTRTAPVPSRPGRGGAGRGGARSGAAVRAGPRPCPGHHLGGGVRRRRMDTSPAVPG